MKRRAFEDVSKPKVTPTPGLAGAKLLRSVRDRVGGDAMGGLPPVDDGSSEVRFEIAMEAYRQSQED